MRRSHLTVALLALLLWTAFLAFMFRRELRLDEARIRGIALSQSRTLFDQVVDMRSWNSAHGGVYVEVTERTPISLSSTNQQELASLLQERFGTDRANQVLQQAGGARSGFSSVLEFYARSGLSLEEFEEIESDLTVSTNSSVEGLVNVNTASENVLACIPGIGLEKAGTLVATPRFQRLFAKAEDEAKRLRDDYVSVEHLALALLDDDRRRRSARSRAC